jgi:tRNA G18 (ribose-2'-O)-methylase SpoU
MKRLIHQSSRCLARNRFGNESARLKNVENVPVLVDDVFPNKLPTISPSSTIQEPLNHEFKDQGKELGKQIFGEDAWKAILQANPMVNNKPFPNDKNNVQDGEFIFHNRRGKLPALNSEVKKLIPKYSFLYGVHVVEIALSVIPKKALLQESKLYIQDGVRHTDKLQVLAAKIGIQILISSKQSLDQASLNGNHQGVLLDTPLIQEYLPLNSRHLITPVLPALSFSRQLILVFDSILDPILLGTLLRTSLFFNVFAIIVGMKTSAPLSSPFLTKSSGGASLLLTNQQRLFGVDNIGEMLSAHHRNGWRVVGCSPNFTTSSNKSKKYIFGTLNELASTPPEEKLIIVFGDYLSRGELRTNIKQCCFDGLVKLESFAKSDIIPLTLPNTLATVLARVV